MTAVGSHPTAAHPSTRVIVGITIALAIIFACITSPYYLFGADPARYVALARSLVHGEGYRFFGQPELSFPPGFSMVLAPAALLPGGSFASIARWAAVVGALVFPATYAFARTRTAALPIAVLTISSAGFLDLVIGNPRSESIYMACSLSLLAWAQQGASRPQQPGRSAAFTAAGAALVLMSVATRAIGVAVVGAFAMVVLERLIRPGRDSRRLPSELVIPLVTGVVFLVAWFAWSQALQSFEAERLSGGSYLTGMLLRDPHHPDLGSLSPMALLSRILGNLRTHLNHAAELLTQLPWIKPRWFSPTTVAVLALIWAGLLTELRRPSRLVAWYFLGYGAILLLWPYDEGTRFLVPLLPLLWVFAVAGARQLIAAASAGSRALRLGVIAVGSACLLGAGVSLVTAPAEFSRQDQTFALVWVFVVGTALFGWGRAAAWIGSRPGRLGRAALIGALALYAAAGVARTIPLVLAQYRERPFADQVTEAIRESSRWVSANTRPDASVQSTFPVPIQFATGRNAVWFPSTSTPEEHRRYIDQFHPDFLIILRDTRNPYYRPMDSEKFAIVQALYPGAWREIARLNGSTIYAFR